MNPPSAPLLHVHVSARGIDERLSVPLEHALAFGRDDTCDVELPSATVSRRHMSVYARDGGLVVRDHSSNGTRVNGQRLHLGVREVGRRAQLVVGPYAIALGLDARPVESDVELVVESQPDGAVLVADDGEQVQSVGTLAPTLEEPVLAMPPDPLELVLRDPAVRRIVLHDVEQLFVERAGRLVPAAVSFADAAAAHASLQRLLSPLGVTLDASRPLVETRLQDGSYVHAVLPPIAQRGLCFTIHRPRTERLELSRLVELGTLSQELARFLTRAVQARVALVITGGARVGKTTLLDALSTFIPAHERVVTVEEIAELAPTRPHVVSLVSRPPGVDGARAIDMPALLSHALRLRFDRVLLGECRGGETHLLLQAVQAGLAGAMTTLLAEHPEQALPRIEALCLTAAPELARVALRRQLAGLELWAHLARGTDHRLRLLKLSQLVGLDERGELVLRDLFVFEPTGVSADGRIEGVYVATDAVAACCARFERASGGEGGPCV